MGVGERFLAGQAVSPSEAMFLDLVIGTEPSDRPLIALPQ